MTDNRSSQSRSRVLIAIILLALVIAYYSSHKKPTNDVRANFPTYTPSHTNSARYSDDGEQQRHDQAMRDIDQSGYEERRRQAIRNGDNPDLVSK